MTHKSMLEEHFSANKTWMDFALNIKAESEMRLLPDYAFADPQASQSVINGIFSALTIWKRSHEQPFVLIDLLDPQLRESLQRFPIDDHYIDDNALVRFLHEARGVDHFSMLLTALLVVKADLEAEAVDPFYDVRSWSWEIMEQWWAMAGQTAVEPKFARWCLENRFSFLSKTDFFHSMMPLLIATDPETYRKYEWYQLGVRTGIKLHEVPEEFQTNELIRDAIRTQASNVEWLHPDRHDEFLDDALNSEHLWHLFEHLRKDLITQEVALNICLKKSEARGFVNLLRNVPPEAFSPDLVKLTFNTLGSSKGWDRELLKWIPQEFYHLFPARFGMKEASE
jgi:hypothetical protein